MKFYYRALIVCEKCGLLTLHDVFIGKKNKLIGYCQMCEDLHVVGYKKEVEY